MALDKNHTLGEVSRLRVVPHVVPLCVIIYNTCNLGCRLLLLAEPRYKFYFILCKHPTQVFQRGRETRGSW